MQVMAFAMDPARLRSIEHNRRFYADRYSTPVYEHLMELTVQADFTFHEMNEANRYRSWPCAGWEREYADELTLAHDHVSIMHEQVSASWQQLQCFDWNVEHGMSLVEATERMA